MVRKNKFIINCLLFILALLAINYLASLFHIRFDLTQDKRYTLSKSSKTLIDALDKTLVVDVFLAGDFPDSFVKLQEETRQLLEEYEAINPNLKFDFINPVPQGSSAQEVAQDFIQKGLRPEQVQIRQNGKLTQELFFPWAIASSEGKSVAIPLLKKKLGASPEELVSRSTQNLEYAFTDAFSKLLNPKSKRIAVLKGNGTLDDRYIADLFRTLRDRYYIAPFTLDSIAQSPQKTMDALNNFDLIVTAKPTQAYTDAQKYALDQYIMQGGKSLWLVDQVAIETDSLYNESGSTVALGRNLNLGDLFFKYGVRINPVLTQDVYAAPIVLASGQGSNSEYAQLPWFYYPLITAQENHPINTNLDNPIRLQYANQIDTLVNEIIKTPLLQTSQLSRIKGVPQLITLDEVNLEPTPQQYTAGSQIVSVLLEGKFTSAFQNRIKPLEGSGIRFRESATEPTKMIVVADGDLIKNDLDAEGRPVELGFDRLTYKEYGNKEFLLNAVNYLLDDTGLINIRSKNILLPALDSQRIIEDRSTWQALMIGLPLLILSIFGLVYFFLRKRRYA